MPAHTSYRAIIRFSLDDDDNSAVRNGAIARLQLAGFNNTNTGAWETPLGDIIAIKTQLNAVLDEIATLSADPNYSMTLDHIWFYIDKVDEPKINLDES
jgi:hypothetical protein